MGREQWGEREEEKLLLAKLRDAMRRTQERRGMSFLPFVDRRQAAVLRRGLTAFPAEQALFWGGHEDAERCMLGIFSEFSPPETEAFPIKAVELTAREIETLSHRDILGAVMAAGVKREMVGDILFERERAVLFATETVARFLAEELRKVGRVGVSLHLLEGPVQVCETHAFQEIRDTVASPRLDSVVASLLSVGRSTAAKLIESGFVSINWVETEKTTAQVRDGDVISIKTKGRFVVDSLSTYSKKGRVILLGRKYL